MDPGAPSLWLDESPSSRLDALQPGNHAVDAVVIGLGITGASAALELAEAGLSVLALDAHGLGWGASARSGGFLLVEHAIEYPARRARFGRERMQTVIEMARSNHRWVEQRFGRAAEHKRCGSLILPMAEDAREQATLAEAAALLREDGVPCSQGAGHEGLEGFAPGLSIPEDGEVHPGRLLAAVGQQAQRSGATLRQALVTDLDPTRRVVTTPDATISYGVAIVAVNAWTQRLLPHIDIAPQRAQMLATRPLGPKRTLGPVCYGCWGYDYFRQRDDGRLLIGGRRHLHRDSEGTDDSVPTDAVQTDLEAYLRRHLSAFGPFEIEARWSGIMGFSPDELPFSKALTDSEGAAATHVLGGMTGHGMGLGAICGQTIARSCTRTLEAVERRRVELLDADRLLG
ncbi:MAG: FAD-binding oxidoreductase [Nannocystaceae bacterium]|nr:FAD-binding oxidoreductase [Nannocystaceae bacterium]